MVGLQVRLGATSSAMWGAPVPIPISIGCNRWHLQPLSSSPSSVPPAVPVSCCHEGARRPRAWHCTGMCPRTSHMSSPLEQGRVVTRSAQHGGRMEVEDRKWVTVS